MTILAAAATATPHRAIFDTRSDQERLDDAIAELATTTSGRKVAEFLRAGSVPIEVLPTAEYQRRYPGSGGAYIVREQKIVLPHVVLGHESLVTTLAHEGKHAMDMKGPGRSYLRMLGNLAGAAGDAALAPLQLRNPVSALVDGFAERTNDVEVAAYRLQAEVAHELGRVERWSLGQADDGTPLSLEQIRANVAAEQLYQLDPGKRLIIGGGIGASGALLGVSAATAVVAKFAPKALPPRASLAIYGMTLAATGALVLADQITARRTAAAG